MTSQNEHKMDPGKTYRWNPRVAARTLEGTAFVLLDSQMVSLNEVGTRIWELLAEPRTPKDVASRIIEEFEVTESTANEDISAFVGLLLEREMLISVERGGAS